MKPRVNLRLDPELHAILEDVAFENQTTKTAVLEYALRHYFSNECDAMAALGYRRFNHFIDQVSVKMKKRRTLSHESLRWTGADPD